MIRGVFFFTLFAFVVFGHILSFNRLETARIHDALAGRMQQIKPVMPPALARLTAGEFKGLMADFMTIEAASAIGSYLMQPGVRMKDLPPQAWDIIYEILETSQMLDPYFSDNYRLVQPFFAWEAQRPQQAIDFLKKGLKARDWDWEIPFFIGFNYFYFLDDKVAASLYLKEAYSRPGGDGSINLATLSAKLLQQAGKTEVGIVYLEGLLKKENSELQRRSFDMRLWALKGTLIVEKAVAAYNQRFGVLPESIDILVETGVLLNIPENPYKLPYCIDQNGGVYFDKPDCRVPVSSRTQ